MAHKGWLESIADADSREAARKKFHEWCEMKESVHDEITFESRQNDVAWLHIQDSKNTYFVRDLTTKYTGNPIRVIDVRPVDENTIGLRVLLANLKVSEEP